MHSLKCSVNVKILSVIILFGLLFTITPMVAHAEAYYVILKWGSTGSGDGQFLSAKGVACDLSGNVYIIDSGNYRVEKFTSTGIFMTKWGSYGSGDGQFNFIQNIQGDSNNAEGIAIDGSGNVYILDSGNFRVEKFTSTGSFITKWGSNGSGDGQFKNPEGIAVDGSGNVYVMDTGNFRVEKFTSAGSFITKWGSSGTGNGQFQYKDFYQFDYIGVDNSSNVYVLDCSSNMNSRVQKFTSMGGFLTSWGGNDSPSGAFYLSSGFAVDGAGNVYVSDNAFIEKYTSVGTFEIEWKTYWNSIGVDSFGNIYTTGQTSEIVKMSQLPVSAAAAPSNMTRTSVLLATFTVNASGGTPPYVYQWYEGANLLSGQTTSQLNIIKDTSGTYTFTCHVTDNDSATVISNSATLTVNLSTPHPSASTTPTPQLSSSASPTPQSSASASLTSKPSGSSNPTLAPSQTSTNSVLPSAPITPAPTSSITIPIPSISPTESSHIPATIDSSSPQNSGNPSSVSSNNYALLIGVALSLVGFIAVATFILWNRRRSESQKPVVARTIPLLASALSLPGSNHIFVSHVQEDSKVAVEIATRLEKAGYRTWYFERDKTLGKDYLIETRNAIMQSQAFVLLISSRSLRSRQVNVEVVRAHECNKPFFPILVDVIHDEIALHQPGWSEVLGATTAIAIPKQGVQSAMPDIIKGLEDAKIEKPNDPESRAG